MPPKTSAKRREPATKRAKTTKAATKPATKTRGKKGRLSVLPTLPLDVLYEVFAHLGPGDLISLARTSKGFRSVLLARQSTFLWREVLDASVEEGYPPRPEDMTEPAWAGFFYGGSFCSRCAAKTTLEVCWAQRRRLCKSCAEEKLVPVVRLRHLELKSSDTEWSSVLSVDERRPLDKEGLDQYDRNRKIPHAYVDDFLAYENKLQELYDGSDSNAEWEQRRAALDAGLKAAVQARFAHAILCTKWESTRTIQRSHELSDVRRERGKEIMKRLMALGHERQDINSRRMREHKDFREPKLLTERVWTRIQPGLVEVVERAHADRLRTEIHERQRQREEAVRIEYVEHILRHVDCSVVPFMPPLDKIYELFPDVKAIIAPDGGVTDSLRESIRDALPAGLPALQHFINERGNGFRQTLPVEWFPETNATNASWPQSDSITTPGQLSVAEIADLDRAAIPVHFGLDALAHFCDRDYNYNPDALRSAHVSGVVFDQACHDVVVHICTILGLNAGNARPLDLDKLDRALVCTNCTRDTGGAIFMTWRDAVAHADPNRRQAHTSKRPVFRLANDLERRYLKAHLNKAVTHGPYESDVWGCAYCTDHLAIYNAGSELYYGRRDKFMSLDNVKKHLEERHNVTTLDEGQDIYFRRDAANESRFVHLPYWGRRDRVEYTGAAEDVILPSVDSDEALEALVLSKETQNQQQAAAAHVEQNWPFFSDDE